MAAPSTTPRPPAVTPTRAPRRVLVVLLLAMLLPAAPAAVADWVLLRDGARLPGSIATRDSRGVEVVAPGGGGGLTRVPLSRLSRDGVLRSPLARTTIAHDLRARIADPAAIRADEHGQIVQLARLLVAVDPTDVEARLLLADVLHAINVPIAATAEAERAAQIAPASIRAQRAAADAWLAHATTGKRARAEPYLRRALDLLASADTNGRGAEDERDRMRARLLADLLRVIGPARAETELLQGTSGTRDNPAALRPQAEWLGSNAEADAAARDMVAWAAARTDRHARTFVADRDRVRLALRPSDGGDTPDRYRRQVNDATLVLTLHGLDGWAALGSPRDADLLIGQGPGWALPDATRLRPVAREQRLILTAWWHQLRARYPSLSESNLEIHVRDAGRDGRDTPAHHVMSLTWNQVSRRLIFRE